MNRVSVRPKRTFGYFARLAALLLALAAGMAVLLGVGAGTSDADASEASTLLKGSFRGNAYGATANAQAGQVATSLGRNAFIPCPCNGTNGKTLSNAVYSVSAGEGGKALKANALRSTVFTEKTSSSAKVMNTSSVSGLNALNGTITADSVKAVANSSATSTTTSSSPAGSTFVNLKVAGRSVSANVAPNTRIDLPGVGYVILKSVRTAGDGKNTTNITVEMLTIVVTTDNAFDLPVGSRVVVAHANSGFVRSEPKANLSGEAFASSGNAKLGTALQNSLGKSAAVYVGCEGTGGVTRTNNVNSLAVPGVISSGTGSTTAFGQQTSTGGQAKTTATAQNLNMLGGRITADTIKAAATEDLVSGVRTGSTTGSTFVNLRVAGIPVQQNVAPNTRLNLPGIGYVVINEQVKPPPSSVPRTKVSGLRVVVTTTNALNLPVGSEIIVANASARAGAF